MRSAPPADSKAKWLSAARNWFASSGLSVPVERVARETLRQSLPWLVIVCGLAASAGALVHILLLEPGVRVLVLPVHLSFVGLGIYWTFRTPARLNLAAFFAGLYLASVIAGYMAIGEADSGVPFAVFIVGALYLSLDRRLCAAHLAYWLCWLAVICVIWIPEGRGLSMLPVQLVCLGGGLAIRHIRLASVERLVALQDELERTANEREAALRRVRDAEKLESLGVMAAGVAHDYNNLLTGVVGGVDLAVSSQTEAQRQEAHDMICASAEALVGLTAQLTEVAGGRPVSMTALSLNELIQQTVVRTLSNAANPRRVRIDLGADVSLVHGEAQSLRQVISSLLNNALQFASNADAAISVGTMSTNLGSAKAVKLWVEDDGPGVAEDIRRRIFDPFFTTHAEGRGLGLAMARAIVQSHRGAIALLQSERGARFEVVLRAAEAEVAPSQRSVEGPSSTRTLANTRGRRVLLIDDNAAVRAVTQRILESLGYSVFQASSGREAVDAVSGNRCKPDLAVIDVLMPGLDGMETLRLLRDIRPALPALLISGYVDTAYKVKVPDHARFLAKPFNAAALRDALALLPAATPFSGEHRGPAIELQA